MSKPLRYSEYSETLTAVVNYLALTKHISRSPSSLAEELGLDETAVIKVLDGFPGLFRKGQTEDPEKKDQRYYTLHLRYATRYLRKGNEGSTSREPLQADHLIALLDLITSRATQELIDEREKRQNLFVMIGAWVAAIIAAITAVLAAILG